MENKNLTAVEWLEEQLNKWSDGRFYLPPHLFEQGKQMEKEQILNARLDGFKGSAEGWNGEYPGWDDKETSIKINNEQYYNETYGGQGSPDTSPNTQNK